MRGLIAIPPFIPETEIEFDPELIARQNNLRLTLSVAENDPRGAFYGHVEDWGGWTDIGWSNVSLIDAGRVAVRRWLNCLDHYEQAVRNGFTSEPTE